MLEWGREDSNLRRLSRRVYSPFPLAARAHPQGGRIVALAHMRFYDAIVVGAGPAGSVTALRLAREGASVLLLDRARFPRDKPCGGGLTGRAVRLLPEPVDSVVEDRAANVRLRARYRGGYERTSSAPLVLLTQRSRLDALLAERAAAAGAD